MTAKSKVIYNPVTGRLYPVRPKRKVKSGEKIKSLWSKNDNRHKVTSF